MGKGAGRLELIARQNELLKQQNDLLREQNELLRQNASIRDEREVFIEEIDRDEMRSGFLVTSHRKKLWNVQIGLINEFARICKKHKLRWFAIGGTLMGAARHRGFIPWDDDVDLAMLRPDYEKFKSIAAQEIKAPYFFDPWNNYRLESEVDKAIPAEENFQLVTLEQEKNAKGWWPFWPMIKLRDSRTTMIQWAERRHVNQSIWIDIFPYDAALPFFDNESTINFKVTRELFIALAFPEQIRDAMQNGKKFLLPYKTLGGFMENLTYFQKTLKIESLLSQIFPATRRLTEFRDFSIKRNLAVYDKEDFADVTYLPFEKIELPAPIGWENILTARYGDWRKMIFTHSHVLDYTTDFSYQEYFKTLAKRTLVTDENSVPTVIIEPNTD